MSTLGINQWGVGGSSSSLLLLTRERPHCPCCSGLGFLLYTDVPVTNLAWSRHARVAHQLHACTYRVLCPYCAGRATQPVDLSRTPLVELPPKGIVLRTPRLTAASTSGQSVVLLSVAHLTAHLASFLRAHWPIGRGIARRAKLSTRFSPETWQGTRATVSLQRQVALPGRLQLAPVSVSHLGLPVARSTTASVPLDHHRRGHSESLTTLELATTLLHGFAAAQAVLERETAKELFGLDYWHVLVANQRRWRAIDHEWLTRKHERILYRAAHPTLGARLASSGTDLLFACQCARREGFRMLRRGLSHGLSHLARLPDLLRWRTLPPCYQPLRTK